MDMDARDYAENASEVFVLSDSFTRIKELIDHESSTIDDIADVILIDPALSATLLKLANSTFFNYPGKIDTITKAVLVLGITEVYNLVIAYFTSKAFKSLTCDDMDYLDAFWEKSVDTALILKYLGEALRIPNSERLFLLGLLHNLGELIVYQLTPEKANQSNVITTDILPWTQQEKTLGFTYGLCSAELLKLWRLPYNLVEPVRNQDIPEFEYGTDESKLLYASKRVMLLNHQCKSHNYDLVLDDAIIKELNLTKELVQKANSYCNMERLSVLALLSPSSVMIY